MRWPKADANHSLLSSAEAKDEWRFTYPYAFIVCTKTNFLFLTSFLNVTGHLKILVPFPLSEQSYSRRHIRQQIPPSAETVTVTRDGMVVESLIERVLARISESGIRYPVSVR